MYKGTLLFYINAIHEGGAERVIIQLAKHFAVSGYRSVLVTSFVDENEYDVPTNVERISIEEKQVQQGKIKRNIRRIRALRRICKEYEPKAIISFMAEPNMRAVLATIGLKTKTIVSVRNDPNKEYAGRLGKFVGKHILPKADGCVFQTEEAKKWFSKSLQKKSKVIFNDVDPIFFETEYVGGNDIVTLGRLSEQKNHKLLIDAFCQISEKHKDTNLLIYGVGLLDDQIKHYISSCDMDSRIFLKGLTTESNVVLSRARCFVLSSDYEGMPNALLEALAVGVPSISTDCPCGGPRVLIENGINGLLVPTNDRDCLAMAMDSVLSDPFTANKYGCKAKELSLRYKTDKVFLEWKNYIETIIDRQ